MRQDGREVGEASQDDEGAYEGVEGGGGADVDAAEEGTAYSAEDDGVEGVLVPGVDLAEEAGEGRGVVARQCPEYTAHREKPTLIAESEMLYYAQPVSHLADCLGADIAETFFEAFWEMQMGRRYSGILLTLPASLCRRAGKHRKEGQLFLQPNSWLVGRWTRVGTSMGCRERLEDRR